MTIQSPSEIIGRDPLLRIHCSFSETPASRTVTEFPDPSATTVTRAEDVIAPLAIVTRILVDRHGLVPAVDRLRIQPPAPDTPTRVVLADIEFVPVSDSRAAKALGEVFAAIGGLARRLSKGGEAEAGTIMDGGFRPHWRFLGPDAAALVATVDPGLAHTVDQRQHSILTTVIAEVAEHTRRWRRGAANRPAVMLDVDLCALDPRRRSHIALRAVAERFDIAEFADPEALGRLPTYHRPAWRRWCEATGLLDRHPDPDGVFTLFWDEFFNPWERMELDEPVPGLARFVWEVQDCGGEVVFNTGRRERVRRHTEAALRAAGVVSPRMVMAPDDRTRPVREHKSENLRAFDDVDIVAVFDDLPGNRRALAGRLPGATMVDVALPGYANEPGDPGTLTVHSFETVPRTGLTLPASQALSLSDTRSLAELDLAHLGDNRAACDAHAAHLDAAASRDLVARLTAHTDATAARIGASTTAALGDADPVTLVHHVVTRERFLKGPRGNYSLDVARRDLGPIVAAGEPIPVVTFGFPVKLHYNSLKTSGIRPDLAELGALMRLRELQGAISAVYPPGARVTVLTDGNHFQPRPPERLRAYHDKLAEYHRLVGGDAYLELADVEEVAARRLGTEAIAKREALIDDNIAAIDALLSGLDVRLGPVPMLAQASRRYADPGHRRGDGTSMPVFADLFRSLMYVVPLSPPPGTRRAEWARRVYADAFNLFDPGLDAALRADRAEMLAETWRRTVRYLAVLTVDSLLGYDDASLFPGRVRLTPNPRPGALGFTYLGGAGVLPWHGTAAVDARAKLSSDFAVALRDRGYVPVYSELLDDEQPWFMVPGTFVRDGELDAAIRDRVHLRRR
ncbi:L-tyrosine/L-tryptophan isonitrile synthase family protein [Stackebrandtia nassauensis]|uniref:Pyoverdine/dityrosine biosynthesis protein n=1 Tax=Stackebrandtia nassauensis (strain DSM 44728 / CIP 108903 / NRRL B-16338 / NBRC 102104 / LLR-40K-21) TaxID=446470 RepID=D3PU87_STANL|nr:L-tyrosine/L-tryptophan isonitrile synthase family protein [Stackebrandtia nassauensis]ADD41033.1 hypothetical protein Snas_1324 [Stackebrandtia nassauensis DSM 44728]